jgi:hypothetical protein
VSSAVDLWNVSENFSIKILSNLNLTKNKLKGLTHSSMPMKFKEMPAQKCREGADKECDKFCAEINGTYCTCIEKLNKWMKPTENFSCFMWMMPASHQTGIV